MFCTKKAISLSAKKIILSKDIYSWLHPTVQFEPLGNAEKGGGEPTHQKTAFPDYVFKYPHIFKDPYVIN